MCNSTGLTKMKSRLALLKTRLNPFRRLEEMRLKRDRESAESVLASLPCLGSSGVKRPILIDGMWDNPGYWTRLSFFRSALGLKDVETIGLTGAIRHDFCKRTLRNLGISRIMDTRGILHGGEDFERSARRLLSKTRNPTDILEWKLPENVPASLIYDVLLKRSRCARVNLGDPSLLKHIAEALRSIAISKQILESQDFEFLILSHVIGNQDGSLAWVALSKGIPVILLFGNNGNMRCAKFHKPHEIYDWVSVLSKEDIADLPTKKCKDLETIGESYLKNRLSGKTCDIGAQYAYQRRHTNIERELLTARMGWDMKRPIIGVYASNWFDYPHVFGMSHFSDFLDWLEATVDEAVANKHVNWLFKAHPCDEWYGGVTLRDLMPDVNCRHIAQADNTWNGSALIDCLDGLVTCHGTAGIEFAATGKPVLLADRGWYHNVGFAKWSKSRKEYLNALRSSWWEELNMHETSRLAKIFAGWHFGRPKWQGNFQMPDDSVQFEMNKTIPALIRDNEIAVIRELETLRQWFYSGNCHYHAYKMSLTEDYLV